MSDTNTPDDQEPVLGFDQTNGLAGDLVGDTDEATADGEGAADDDRESDIGSIYTGHVSAGVGRDTDADQASDDSDGEEPV